MNTHSSYPPPEYSPPPPRWLMVEVPHGSSPPARGAVTAPAVTHRSERAVTPTYKIVRFYEDASRRHHTITTGFTLAEAQAYCHLPESSSLTCRTEIGKRRTQQFGQWIEGYVRETTGVDGIPPPAGRRTIPMQPPPG